MLVLLLLGQCIRSLSGAGTAADFDIPPVSDGQLGVVPGVEVQDVQAAVEGGGGAGSPTPPATAAGRGHCSQWWYLALST